MTNFSIHMENISFEYWGFVSKSWGLLFNEDKIFLVITDDRIKSLKSSPEI